MCPLEREGENKNQAGLDFLKQPVFCFEPRERLFPLPDYAFSELKVGKRLK